MFKKYTIPKTEHNFLLCITLMMPVLVLGLISVAFFTEVYKFFFPPEPTFFVEEWSLVFPAFALFRLSVLLTLITSSCLIFRKRIFLSVILYLIPALFFAVSIIDLNARLLRMIEINQELGYNDFSDRSFVEIVWNQLAWADLFCLAFITFIFLWHTKILIQDKFRENLSQLP